MIRNISDSEKIDYIVIGMCIGFMLGFAFSFFFIIQ